MPISVTEYTKNVIGHYFYSLSQKSSTVWSVLVVGPFLGTSAIL